MCYTFTIPNETYPNKYYIAVKAPPKYHQMTLDELVYGLPYAPVVCKNETNTRTYEVDEFSERFLRDFSVDPLIEKLEQFNRDTEPLRNRRRRSMYYSFTIPKESGGLRHIDAPEVELMDALRRLKYIFENDFHPQRQFTTIQTTYYHTSAFAYIKKRSTIDCLKRHQANESKWFAKLDFSNFFGTTTLDFTMRMLAMIFPFSEICKNPHGREELYKAVELGFLDGVLPQGTPLSPTITNIIMLPIDYRLFNTFRKRKFVYTRYADDMQITSRYHFPVKLAERIVVDALKEFGAPYRLKREKTRYGSVAGSNWNLGLMLNKNNEITVGHSQNKHLKNMLYNFERDRRNGIHWDPSDIYHVLGLYSYYRSIEGDYIDRLTVNVARAFKDNCDIIANMKRELTPA